MWETRDVTPVTHARTDGQWKVVQYSVWAESAIFCFMTLAGSCWSVINFDSATHLVTPINSIFTNVANATVCLMKPRGVSVPHGSKVLCRSLICLLLFKICCSNSASGTIDGRAEKPPVFKPKKCKNYREDENKVSGEGHNPSSCISHCWEFEFAMFHVAEVTIIIFLQFQCN